MKAFMTSGSVICPFFYAFFLFSLPTAVLCQIPVPSPSASVNVLNSGLPHHQSTFISLPLDAYQASSIPAVVEISGGVGGLVARNDEFAVLTTAVPSADPTGEDRGSAGVLISEVTSDALPTRTFRNIAATTDTASVETTTTSSSTETDSSTSTTAAASTDTSAAASSLDTTTAITATEVGTSTSTETTYTDSATSSVTSDVPPTRTFQDTTTTTTPEPTETPPAPTTSVDRTTRTVKTVLTLTITKIATAPHTHAPTPPAGAGAWQACGNGITCAFGHRCITFRGLVMVCVPGRGRHRQHHD